MKKEQAEALVRTNMSEGEQLVGFFNATYTLSIWWFLLIGPLLALGTRVYVVGVTDRGVHFHKLSLFGKPDQNDFFAFADITRLRIGNLGLVFRMAFLFSNKRKLKINAVKVGSKKIAKIDTQTLDYIKQHTLP